MRKSVLIHHEIMSWFVSYVCCDELEILNLKVSQAKCAKLPNVMKIQHVKKKSMFEIHYDGIKVIWIYC